MRPRLLASTKQSCGWFHSECATCIPYKKHNKKKISQYAEWVCSIHFPIASATAPWYFQKWKFADAASRNSSDGQQNLRYSPGVIRISPFSCMSWRRGQHSSASQQSHFTFNSRSLHKQETKQKKTDIFFFFSSDNFFFFCCFCYLDNDKKCQRVGRKLTE